MKPVFETKVLVTGASGFLGSHLTERLSGDGYKVYALLRRMSNTRYLQYVQNVEVRYGDLLDVRSLKTTTKDIDVVIHCAALMSNFGWLKKKEFYKINCIGTKNMLDASIYSGIKQFIHISTVGVLGGSNHCIPADEHASYGNRLSNYEWSKCEAEKVLLNYCRKNKNPAITIVRPAQLYGPRMVYGWLPTLDYIKEGKFRIIGDGASLIHLTYIDDVINGIICLILKQEAFGQIYHFAGPEAVSLKDIFVTMAKYLYAPAPKSVPFFLVYYLSAILENTPNFIKPKTLSLLNRHRVRFFKENHVYDISKARTQLGYTPQVNLDTGIKKMIDWFVENGYLLSKG